jgi:phage head maturation protease
MNALGTLAEAPANPDADYPNHGEAEGLAAPHLSNEGGARVLLCFATHAMVRLSRCQSPFRLDMAGADLSLLNSGRAPLLADHDRSLGGILGVVETAWIDTEAGAAFAIARFAPTDRGQEAQAMVAASVLANCSMGFAMSPVEELEGGSASASTVAWWRPFEVSLVAVPANWHSSVKVAPPGLLDRQAAEASAARAKAMRDGMAAQRDRERQAWASTMAPMLAERFGIDPAQAAEALTEAMGAAVAG